MKLSLRDLLLVITIIAIGLGWFVDRQRLQGINAELNAENAELISRLLPASGFAFPAGIATRATYLHARFEDRKELLFLLDQALSDQVQTPRQKPERREASPSKTLKSS